jgi:SAM-dependent methyltransferase
MIATPFGGFSIHAWVILFEAVSISSLLLILWIYLPVLWGAPWSPIPMRVANRMLQMADLKPGQTLIDLGAGDGRLVILAARIYKVRAVGVEIDPFRCLIANCGIILFGLRRRAEVRWGDFRGFSTTGADVVMLYLLQGTNQALKASLEKSLRPGAKIISHVFSMSGWTPVALDDRNGIFVYEIGRTGDDTQTKFCS